MLKPVPLRFSHRHGRLAVGAPAQGYMLFQVQFKERSDNNGIRQNDS
jgi:hypothetical protein